MNEMLLFIAVFVGFLICVWGMTKTGPIGFLIIAVGFGLVSICLKYAVPTPSESGRKEQTQPFPVEPPVESPAR